MFCSFYGNIIILMGEIIPSPEEVFTPGLVIELEDLPEFVQLENSLAEYIDSTHNPVLWDSRPPIRDLLTPSTFNGRLTEIKLIVMDHAYERLLDSRERGFRIQRGGGNYRLSPALEREYKDRYLGFTFIAQPRSTHPRELSQLQAELWYFPISPQVLKAGTRTGSSTDQYGNPYSYNSDHLVSRSSRTGQAIRRVVTHTKYEEEEFIELDEEAKRIGLAVIKQSLRTAIKVPMRGYDA
jgi:hypothetical protein